MKDRTYSQIGFRWHLIDRCMWTGPAVWGTAAAAWVLMYVLLASAEPAVSLRQTIAITAFSVLAAAAVQTWRRLWRRGRDEWEQAVYDVGVRGYGASLAAAFLLAVVIFAPTRFADFRAELLWRIFLTVAASGTIVTTCLWSGYVWGLAIAAFSGRSGGERSRNDLPPRLQPIEDHTR